MTHRTLDRRTFIGTTAALGATTLLAGCTGAGGSGDGSGDGGSGSDESGGDGGGSGDDDGSDGDGSGGDSGGDEGGEFLSEEPNYDGWFENVGNYEGTVDRTGADEVTLTSSPP